MYPLPPFCISVFIMNLAIPITAQAQNTTLPINIPRQPLGDTLLQFDQQPHCRSSTP